MTTQKSKKHVGAKTGSSVNQMPLTLVLNAGSSSVKFKLFDGEIECCRGTIDRIGSNAGTLDVCVARSPASLVRTSPGKCYQRNVVVRNYDAAGKLLLEILGNEGFSHARISRVVHRVVHGSKRSAPVVITPAILQELRANIPLAPLHLPASIALISYVQRHTKATAVACFDTMFHRTMPEAARTYPIPQNLAKTYHIERYGFHGIAHEALAREAAHFAGKDIRQLRIITCQLGNGASICAIKDGKSIDTSMGFTPLEGIIMGTRSGSIDPAIVGYLSKHERSSAPAIVEMLEKRSGLLALGGSSDVRDLLDRYKKKDSRAILALDVLALHVRRYIGAYSAVLGGVDVIVLGGGVSRSPVMRKKILGDLEYLGVVLNERKINAKYPVLISKPVASKAGSSNPSGRSSGRDLVQVWVIEADEERHMLHIATDLFGKA